MLILVFISIFYWIVYNDRSQECNKMLCYYLIIITLVFAPIVGNLMGTLVGNEVLWRMGWLLIVPIMLAYTYTHWYYLCAPFQEARKLKVVKSICAVVVFVCLWSSKEFLFTKSLFSYEQNIYKIADESIQVADYLVEEEEFYVLTTSELASQIRQYEPKIHFYAGRWPNYENKHSVYVHAKINDEIVDTKEVVRKCKEQNCGIVILKDEILSDSMESLGASLIKEIGGYKIYRIVI